MDKELWEIFTTAETYKLVNDFFMNLKKKRHPVLRLNSQPSDSLCSEEQEAPTFSAPP